MKTQIISLETIRVNDSNPRTITEAKFDQLVDSILSFPKMLGVRPIVVDEAYISQGGNMRYRALSAIASMKIAEIKNRLEAQASFIKKLDPERKLLLNYWEKWLKKPVAEIVMADDFTEDELKEFLVKDNVGFGTWDWDVLANNFDEAELTEWGLDVWQSESYADKNAEVDTDSIQDEMILKLKFTESEYNLVTAALSKIASTPELSIKKLLSL